MKIIMLLCAATIGVQPVTAATRDRAGADAVQNIVVSFADIDIRSASGQKRLNDRISYAAYTLCLANTPASPSPAPADPACVRDTVSRAGQQVARAIARANGGPMMAAAAGTSAR